MNDTIMFEVMGWMAALYGAVVLVEWATKLWSWLQTRESIGDRWIREDKENANER